MAFPASIKLAALERTLDQGEGKDNQTAKIQALPNQVTTVA